MVEGNPMPPKSNQLNEREDPKKQHETTAAQHWNNNLEAQFGKEV